MTDLHHFYWIWCHQLLAVRSVFPLLARCFETIRVINDIKSTKFLEMCTFTVPTCEKTFDIYTTFAELLKSAHLLGPKSTKPPCQCQKWPKDLSLDRDKETSRNSQMARILDALFPEPQLRQVTFDNPDSKS